MDTESLETEKLSSEFKALGENDGKIALSLNEKRVGHNNNLVPNEAEEKKEETTPINIIHSLSWLDSISISIQLKTRSLSAAFYHSLITIFILSLFMEEEWGIINQISKSSNTSHFFICIASGIMGFFVGGDSIKDFKAMLYNFHFCVWWVVLCIICRLIFPKLIGNHFNESSQPVPPSGIDKAFMFIMFFVADWIGSILHQCSWYLFLGKILIKYYPSFMGGWVEAEVWTQNASKVISKATIGCFFDSLIFTWFPFALIFAIAAISLIPQLNPNVEIFLFGYLMPILKAFVSSMMYSQMIIVSENGKWGEEKTSKFLSGVCASAVIITTLSNLYVIFRGANDYNFFIAQYLPHELIKKISWLSFHPLFLKIQMKAKDVFSSMYNRICKKKDEVIPLTAPRSESIDFTSILNSNASGLMGKQFGEDYCMFLLLIWMLPIAQEYVFGQIYQPSSSSLPFPTYNDIGAMILGIGFGIESLSTIASFAALQRVGTPLVNNSSILEFNIMVTGAWVFGPSAYLIVLAAALIY